jgi:hypothetical protein
VLAEVDIGRYKRFWVAALEEVLVLASVGTGDGDAHGFHGPCWRRHRGVCASLTSTVSALEGNLRSWGSCGDVVCVFRILGSIVLVPTYAWGL